MLLRTCWLTCKAVADRTASLLEVATPSAFVKEVGKTRVHMEAKLLNSGIGAS